MFKIHLISRYLIWRMALMTLYALLALLALYSFFDVLNEVGDIGSGGYTGATAFRYVLMQMPAHAYQLMPLAVLVGGLIALNQLSGNSELAVIKTSGLSTAGIIRILLMFALVFAVATALLGEWLAPELSRRADAMKSTAQNGQVSATEQGVWIKQRDSMVNIARMLPDGTLADIKIWQYDGGFKLVRAVAAEKAQVHHSGWTLENVRSSTLTDERILVENHAQQIWPSEVGKKLLDVLLVKPEQMSLSALGGYIRYLEDNNQQTVQYRVEWWNKLVYPAAALVMALVAYAFTPQSGRSTNMGLKLFGGICLGLLFYFAGRLFGFTSRLYGVPPFVAAVLPTLAFGIWAVYLIRKHERR